MKKERCCRTCIYWGKPKEKRSHAGAVYPCAAPLPILTLPESITKANGHEIEITRRSYMGRDEGKTCHAWVPSL